jgi:hypothetical protein
MNMVLGGDGGDGGEGELGDGGAVINPLTLAAAAGGTALASAESAVDAGKDVKDADQINLDAELVPDYFARVRGAMFAAEGTMRLMFWVAKYLFYYNILVGPFAYYYSQSTRNIGNPKWNESDGIFSGVLFTCALSPIMYVSYLPRVIAAGGPLHQLGAGQKRVAAGKTKWLKLWMVVLGGAAVGCFLFGVALLGWIAGQVRGVVMYESQVERRWADTEACQVEATADGNVRRNGSPPLHGTTSLG